MAIIQEQVSVERLGRVFSLYFGVAILPSMIGLLFTGFIADAIGVATAFIIAGFIVVLVGLLSFFNGSIMALERKHDLDLKRKSFQILEAFLSERRDSNSRPQPWQGCALPTELLSRWCYKSKAFIRILQEKK